MQNPEFPVEEPGISIHVSLDDNTFLALSNEKDVCPSCRKYLLIRNGSCSTCSSCGWSACEW